MIRNIDGLRSGQLEMSQIFHKRTKTYDTVLIVESMQKKIWLCLFLYLWALGSSTEWNKLVVVTIQLELSFSRCIHCAYVDSKNAGIYFWRSLPLLREGTITGIFYVSIFPDCSNIMQERGWRVQFWYHQLWGYRLWMLLVTYFKIFIILSMFLYTGTILYVICNDIAERAHVEWLISFMF